MLGIANDNSDINTTMSYAVDDIIKVMRIQFNDREYFYKRFVLKGIINGVAQMSFNKGRELEENYRKQEKEHHEAI